MQRLRDVVVLLPGIMGSVLRRNGKDVWAPTVNGLLNAALSGGEDIQALTLTDDPPDELDLNDGVTVGGIMPTAHIFPGLWKIDGYSETRDAIHHFLSDVKPGRNYFEFAYDWRRTNRVAAKKLKLATDACLQQWRTASDGNPKAKLILIAHSMGGLVARYFLEVLEGWRDTRALITFGTPYSGSLNALNFLANGYRKAWGLVDLSQMVRSFTSIYQLLPTYKCCDFGDGSLSHVDDARGIPNVRLDKVTAALAFHREIADKVAVHNQLDEYRTNGYRIYPVIGTHQPTLQSARIVRAKSPQVELMGDYLGQDDSGDGTVPRVSATPLEWTDATQGMFSAGKHASLQNAQPVLDHLEGVLTGMYMDHPIQRVAPACAKGERLVHLGVDLDDAFEQSEPILVKAYPDAADVILRATIQDAETRIVVSEQTLKKEAGLQTAEFAHLPKGTYRITVAGDQRVLPVTDLFEVFPGITPSGRSRGLTSARPIVVGSRLDASAEDGEKRGAEVVNGRQYTAPLAVGPAPVKHAAPPPSLAPTEGTTVTRYPSIQIAGEIEPRQRVSLSVDLARLRDELTQSPGLVFDAPEGWKQFRVGVHIVAPDLEFTAGEDNGEIVVQNGADSIPLTRSVRVARDLGGRDHMEVRASFVYNGRVCGSARRGFQVREPVTASTSIVSGSTTGVSGTSLSSSPAATATVTAAPTSTAVATALPERKVGDVVIPQTARKAAPLGETTGNCQIAPGVAAPKMTIEMFHSEGMPAGMLLWHIDCPDQVRAECTLPSNLCGTVNLGLDAAEYVAELFAGCENRTPPDHMLFFEGLGEKLYEKTPSCFREVYWAMVDRYGSDFPIQIMSDDPYVPWELMRPYRSGNENPEFLGFTHPVARWFVDQEGKGGRQSLLPTGIVATIVPDYSSRPELQPLVAAQREKTAIKKMLNDRAEAIEGTKADVVSVLEDNSNSNICLLHYAGHGDCDTSKTDFARLTLEDNDLEVLEVRRSGTKLGRHRHALVFLNACRVARSGLNMGVIGGFAEALMQCDFGGLIAPLWAIYDDSAAMASKQFIDETVLKNKPFAEVLRDIRKSYGPDCPTFLSYLYYGDVMAKFA